MRGRSHGAAACQERGGEQRARRDRDVTRGSQPAEDLRDTPWMPSHDHCVPRTCWAAVNNSAANDDWELAVPGPGSKFSSLRVRPAASMTYATSLCPIIPPAGGISAATERSEEHTTELQS